MCGNTCSRIKFCHESEWCSSSILWDLSFAQFILRVGIFYLNTNELCISVYKFHMFMSEVKITFLYHFGSYQHVRLQIAWISRSSAQYMSMVLWLSLAYLIMSWMLLVVIMEVAVYELFCVQNAGLLPRRVVWCGDWHPLHLVHLFCHDLLPCRRPLLPTWLSPCPHFS